jgi:hypothetical protein
MSPISVNLDKSQPSNFSLVFPKLPTEATLGATDELTLNIHGTIIPGLALDTVEGAWLGAIVQFDSGRMTFEPWTIEFTVDSQFLNWRVLYRWLVAINNNKDKHGALPSEYLVDATLRVTDNFKNEILRIYFSNVWINMLGELSFTMREGEANLECTCQFVYDRFELREVSTAS